MRGQDREWKSRGAQNGFRDMFLESHNPCPGDEAQQGTADLLELMVVGGLMKKRYFLGNGIEGS